MTLLNALHSLAAVVWIGGAFFALVALRPALQALPAEAALPVWRNTLGRFFPWVLGSIVLLFVTGYAMVFGVYGGFRSVGLHVHLMNGLGLLMMLAFLHAFFAPWARMRRLLGAGDIAGAGGQLRQIRLIMAVNLVLGLLVVAIATGGRYAL